MKIKALALSASLVAAFTQFASTTHASNTVPALPDEMILNIFSHLEPHQVGSKASVSQQFNRVACDSHSPIGQVNSNPGGKELYKFCTAQRFEFGEVLSLAHQVVAMTSNPIPNIISQQQFSEAKKVAQEVIDLEK